MISTGSALGEKNSSVRSSVARSTAVRLGRRLLRTSFAPEELTLAGLHTGLHLLAQLKDPPPDAALRAAARQYGVRCSLLSDYDLTGTAHSAAGTLVLGYGSLPDADCAAAGERLKKLCTAAREASDTV